MIIKRKLSLAVFVTAMVASSVTATQQRIYMLGNSLTDDILYDGFAAIVTGAGNTLVQGSQRVPGAPIFYLWDNPTSGFTHTSGSYPNAFANYTWDAITLQPFSSYGNELQHARFFAQAIRGAGTFGPDDSVPPTGGAPTGISPNAKVFIYAQWPSAPETWPSATWLTQGTGSTSAAMFETFVTDLRTQEPSTSVYLIPAGHIFHELHQLTRAGRLPGITRHGDLMSDSIHLNDRGSYIPAIAFYSVIYGADPRGLAVPSQYPLTAAQATVIQNAAWKVISKHPLTGFTNTVTITTPSLPDCPEDTAYSTTFTTALATGAVTWAMAPDSTLPAGLSLSSTGVLSGMVATPGIYDLTVRATDSLSNHSDRDFILFVVSNNPPVVSTASLATAPYGAPYSAQLANTSGVGSITWSISKGDLPHGLSLSVDGRLLGTPVSVQGTFTLTFKATDSLGATGEKSLALTVTPPEAGTLIVAPLTTAPVIDGVLNESFWTLPNTADRRLYGVGNNSTTFGVRYDAAALYVAVKVVDGTVLPGQDAIHLYLDAKHDREIAYNADDRHLVIHPNGTFTELNGRPTGITVATATSASGYTAEISIPLTNLELNPDGQSFSVGFDLDVEDWDSPAGPATHQLWLGTDPLDPTPATMGNLVLAAGPVGANLLVNPGFDSAITGTGYPGKATTALAGLTWQSNGVFSRPFGQVDALGYGYPTRAIIAPGVTPGTCTYQVIKDSRTTKGQGILRFDIKLADADIAYRLFAYNGTDDQVNALMGTESQQHPAKPGTPTATLLSGTLATIPVSTTWREVALPVDFGTGYDYYVFAFSGAGGDAIPLDSRVDNVHLGAVTPEQSIGMTSPAAPTLTLSVLTPNGGETGPQPIVFKVSRAVVSPFAYPISLVATGTASNGVDYSLPASIILPGRATSVNFTLTPLADNIVEGPESVTLTLAADAAYTIGTPASANGVIADSLNNAWYFNYFGAVTPDWTADPNADGIPNLIAFALDLSPLESITADKLPAVGTDNSTPNGPWLTYDYRKNLYSTDLTYTLRTSTDLINWVDLPVDNLNVFAETLNADPDGDGSAELVRVRIKYDPLQMPVRFLKLQVSVQ